MAVKRITLVPIVLLVAAGCTTTSDTTTTAVELTTTSSTTLIPTTSTTAAATTTSTTTTAPTTTTTAPTTTTTAGTTTTADPPPGQITGVAAGLGGGSGEVFVTWDASAAGDLAEYRIYYSENPGGTKTLLTTVDAGTTQYIDFPRDLTEGINCYQVSAVDTGGNEGQRSTEACFSAG